jgi:dynein heavy chain 1
MRKEVQGLLTEGVGLVWESYKLDPYVQRLAESVFNFQEKVDDLLVIEEQIEREVKAIDTCHYGHGTFMEVLIKVQKAVDDLSLHQYSNLPQWVTKLDQQVEGKLASRLEAGLKAWTECLIKGNTEEEEPQESMDTEAAPTKLIHKAGGEPRIKQMLHELRITNQVMYLGPPVEDVRQSLMMELFSWENVIRTLPRISHARYQVGLDAGSEAETSYKNLLTKLPSGSEQLQHAYETIEKLVGEVREYVEIWLKYQALWDLQPDQLYERLGTNLNKWMATLEEFKAARKTFDTSESSKEFGPVTIEFGKVQSKVTLKYDSWHKEVSPSSATCWAPRCRTSTPACPDLAQIWSSSQSRLQTHQKRWDSSPTCSH